MSCICSRHNAAFDSMIIAFCLADSRLIDGITGMRSKLHATFGHRRYGPAVSHSPSSDLFRFMTKTCGMSSATTVLNTYELLEHILLHLPLRDLLLAEGVCMTWRIFIRESAPISMALFRKTKEQLDVVGKRVYSTNDAPATVEWTDTATGTRFPVPLLNPFMASVFREEGVHQKLLSALLFRNTVGGLGQAFYHEAASWGRMLPRQPVQSNYTISCMIPGAGVNTVKADKAPITLGDLSDGLRKHIINCKKCDGCGVGYHVTGLAMAGMSTDISMSGWQLLEETRLWDP